MAGFFDIEDITPLESVRPRGGKASNRSFDDLNLTCTDCGLDKGCRSPYMPATGKGRRKVLVIAEAPGAEEDRQNTQLIGASGQLLRKELERLDWDLDQDCWKTNAVRCRPHNNATPTPLQIAACRKSLMALIAEKKPVLIIVLGKTAWEALVGPRITGRAGSSTFSDWAGQLIPDQELKTWVTPMWHPSYVLRETENSRNHPPHPDMLVIWRRQLRAALKKAGEPFVECNYRGAVTSLFDPHEAIKVLAELRRAGGIIAFDYETTGRKPHRPGHQIVSVAVSAESGTWAMPFFENEEFREAWRKFLLSPKVKKIAHLASFEASWSHTICGVWPEGWHWDTLLGSHCEQSQKPAGLKFQVYAKIGVVGYDGDVDEYLRCSGVEETQHGANGFNRIHEVPIADLLYYNGLDAFFTRRLWQIQAQELPADRQAGLLFFLEASIALTKSHALGMKIDEEIMGRQEQKVARRLQNLNRAIDACEEVQQWDGADFNFNSSQQLAHLLHDILKIPCESRTASYKEREDAPDSEGACMDEDSLSKIDIPLTRTILEYRRWQKVEGTYLGQFRREMVDGIVRPFYNLHTVNTFRSSSDKPNFQNIPKRDKEIKALIRSFIRPRPGNRIIEYDYKAVEAGIVPCYNKDPVWIQYIENPASDMHRDQASKLFIREPSAVSKEERQGAKNGFVFPTVYGSYYKNTAANLWNAAKPDTLEHLAQEGIRNQRDFTAHVRDVEEEFWNLFHVGYEWMTKTLADYEKKGYIDLYTGFRCYGPLTRNQVINYRIQGSAFHVLLWTFTQVSSLVRAQLPRSDFIGQIHDAAVGDICAEDEPTIDYWMWDYGTRKVREHWPWIIVPLSIEKERSAIGGCWAEMEGAGYLTGAK